MIIGKSTRLKQLARSHNNGRSCRKCPILSRCTPANASTCALAFERGFLKGYEKAEITIDDIKSIIKIADDMFNNYSRADLVTMKEKGYYAEVLQRFKKEKNGKLKNCKSI